MTWLVLALLTLFVWWLNRSGVGGRRDAPRPRRSRFDSPSPVAAGEGATSIAVVCTVVTPARQEWKSLRTGRLYDVTRANGVPDAVVGDRGVVVMTSSGWRVTRVPVTRSGGDRRGGEAVD